MCETKNELECGWTVRIKNQTFLKNKTAFELKEVILMFTSVLKST